MLRAQKSGENALLESPTGTGKTLCLLSAAVAFLDAYSKNQALFDGQINPSASIVADADGSILQERNDKKQIHHANCSLPNTPDYPDQPQPRSKTPQ